jgi:hypothetical protein
MGVVMGAGISVDVTDMTAPSRPRSVSASLHVAGIKASRLRAAVSPGRVRERESLADTAGSVPKMKSQACPL